MTTNSFRIPLAEWHARMTIAGLEREAIQIAIACALYKSNSNSELAELSGHKAGSRTFEKHRRTLAKDGWVYIPPHQITGGRGRGVTAMPAIDGTPVDFTDLCGQRNHRKIYSSLAKGSGQESTVITTPHNLETTAVTTPQSNKSTVETTPLSLARGNSNITKPKKNNNNNNIYNNTNSARAREATQLPQFNFESEDVTFDKHGNVVLVNGLKQKWLEFFGGDKIAFEAALMAVNIDRGCRTPVEKQVAKQLQYAAQAARKNARGGRRPASSDMEKLKAITGENNR